MNSALDQIATSQIGGQGPANWFVRHERAVAFVLGIAAMTYVQSASYEPAGRDSFYHIKMAVLLPEIGFPERFHWLRHTILNERNVSHHHGFHILMVPFVYASKWAAEHTPESIRGWSALENWLASPEILGAKILDILLFGMVVLVADLIMRNLNVGFRWFWLLSILALPTDFFMRMAYIRAPIASLVFLLLVIHAWTLKRHVLIAILGMAYCHLYGGFVFYPAVLAILVAASALLGGGWRAWLPTAVAGLVGLAIGLCTHPYFPENIAFLKVQLFETGLQTAAVEKVRVGSEWRPIHLDYWLQISAFVLIIHFLSLSIRLTWSRLRQPATLALLLLNFFFLALCLYARRFIEYWPMFCLLSSAALWSRFDEHAALFAASLPDGLSVGAKILQAYRRRIHLALCGVALAISCMTLYQSRGAVKCKFDTTNIQKAMSFLEENTPRGSLVFADDWDEFPMYFYYNHHNDYVCGLDPQFTNSMDPVLWERFCVITQGRSPRQSKVSVRVREQGDTQGRIETAEFRVEISDIIDHFGADYVLVDKNHQPFYRKLCAAPELFEYVYPSKLGDKVPRRVQSLAIFAVKKSPSVSLHLKRELPPAGVPLAARPPVFLPERRALIGKLPVAPLQFKSNGARAETAQLSSFHVKHPDHDS